MAARTEPAGEPTRAGGDPTGALGRGPDGSGAAGNTAVSIEVRRVVQAALDAVSRAGNVSAAGISAALEGAARSLIRRVVAGSAATARGDMGDPHALARALAETPRTPVLASATGAAMALRLAGRFRRLGFLARRTPAFLVAAAVPALVASVARGADELGMVASHLLHRSWAAGVEPDLERVRRVAVQVVSRQVVDPEVEPSHGSLALGWLKRAVRAALPFTSGVATADPEGLASAAGDVDPARLGAA